MQVVGRYEESGVRSNRGGKTATSYFLFWGPLLWAKGAFGLRRPPASSLPFSTLRSPPLCVHGARGVCGGEVDEARYQGCDFASRESSHRVAQKWGRGKRNLESEGGKKRKKKKGWLMSCQIQASLPVELQAAGVCVLCVRWTRV